MNYHQFHAYLLIRRLNYNLVGLQIPSIVDASTMWFLFRWAIEMIPETTPVVVVTLETAVGVRTRLWRWGFSVLFSRMTYCGGYLQDKPNLSIQWRRFMLSRSPSASLPEFYRHRTIASTTDLSSGISDETITPCHYVPKCLRRRENITQILQTLTGTVRMIECPAYFQTRPNELWRRHSIVLQGEKNTFLPRDLGPRTDGWY